MVARRAILGTVTPTALLGPVRVLVSTVTEVRRLLGLTRVAAAVLAALLVSRRVLGR
ncbi:MAG: hypothetical protein ACRDRZ_14230 [Pseudonocardiaceae bacterium]